MERWAAKVIALVAVFILPLIGTLLPYKVSDFFVKKGEKGKKVLSCLMCFGGGVFFATFILHMAPESRMILDQALLTPNNITYPLADLIMGGGFFLVFFLEKLCLKFYKKKQQKKKQLRRERCFQINKLTEERPGSTPCECCDCKPPKQPGMVCDCEGHCRSLIPKVEISDCETPIGNGQISNGAVVLSSPAGMRPNPSDCPLLGTGECCSDPDDVRIKMKYGDGAGTRMMDDGEKIVEDEETVHSHGARSLVLIVALSLHRIFEGMSVGLQHSQSDVWNLLIAVMCHEIVIGFGLGLQFVKNQFSLKRMLLACFLCSAIMPVGVAIGTLLVEVGSQDQGFDLVNGILQAIATGTFIYVTFFEILQEEIDPHDTSMSKFFSVFIGFAVMAALCAVPEDQSVNLKHSGFIAHPANASVLTPSATPGSMVTLAG